MIAHYFQDIQGWFDFQDIYAEAVAIAADGDILVELGVWKGKSLAFLLVEAANSGKQLRIVGVDHFKGSVDEPALQHEASSIDLEAFCRANLEKAGYKFELMVEASPAAASHFADGSIAFLNVDASHDQASVAADLAAWIPKVKPGGMIAGHDFGYPAVRHAVLKSLPDAKPRGSSWFYLVPTAAQPIKKESKDADSKTQSDDAGGKTGRNRPKR